MCFTVETMCSFLVNRTLKKEAASLPLSYNMDSAERAMIQDMLKYTFK